MGNLSDRDLLAASRAYEAKLIADAASLNFGATETAAMTAVNDAFEASLDGWDAIQLQEAEQSETKTKTRKDLLAELRGQRNTAYADTSLDESALASGGMPPRDKVKTASPAPDSAPIGWIDYGKLKHTIHFRDSQTPDKKAKPKGMLGCEIWHSVGETVPTSEDDYKYVATDTNSPYVISYPIEDANQKVYYQLRWVSKSGERGEWSETIEATVNG